MYQLISIALLGFCTGSTLAWSHSSYISNQIRTRHQRMILLADDDHTDKEGEENKLFQDNTNEESSFGISYIGGGKIHKAHLFYGFLCTSYVHFYIYKSLFSVKTLVDQSIMMIHLMFPIISNQDYRKI